MVAVARFTTIMKNARKKPSIEDIWMGVRISENPEYQSSSRYYRGKIERFFLFFLCFFRPEDIYFRLSA